jgi:hypothetical protein
MANQSRNNGLLIGHNSDRRRGLIHVLWNAQGAITVGLLLLVVSACQNNQEAVNPEGGPTIQPATETPEATGTPAATATPEVTATPTAQATTGAATETPNAQLIGETVTVSTKVMKVISPKAFIAQDKESLAGEEVLVVSDFESPAVAVGNNIELTGVMEKFVVADIEKEYGLDLEPEIEKQFRDKAILTAKAIEKVD